MINDEELDNSKHLVKSSKTKSSIVLAGSKRDESDLKDSEDKGMDRIK